MPSFAGVHHVDLVVSSIERSLPFYRDLLAPLGYHRITEVEGERGETIWYLGGPRRGPRPARVADRRRPRPLPRRNPPRRLRGVVARARRRACGLACRARSRDREPSAG